MSLTFRTPTTLSPLAFTLMGASVKTKDNSIGRFGTGLKYAIAQVVARGGSITIVTDDDTYTFDKTSLDFNGTSLEGLTCNNTPLPYTTNYGSAWEDWMLYRELESNTLDESGVTGLMTSLPPRPASHTDIIVEYAPILEAHLRREEYFLNPARTVFYALVDGLTFFKMQGTEGKVFCRGVVVGKHHLPVDVLMEATLTEDRTLRFEYHVYRELENAVLRSDNRQLIEACMNLVTYTMLDASEWSEAARIVVGKAYDEGTLESSLLKSRWQAHQRTVREFVPVVPTPLQVETLAQATRIARLAGIPIQEHVLVKGKAAVLGCFDPKTSTCYITENGLCRGVEDIAKTLIEESIHYMGIDDYSRDFQEKTLEIIMGLIQKNQGLASMLEEKERF